MTTANSDIPPDLASATDVLGDAVPGVSARMRLVGLYELTKPRLNFLVIVTTAVGCYLAAGAAGIIEQPWLFVNVLLGTALTAASAGVLNQYRERSFDALMRRTARRPLPAGHVSPGLALAMGLVLLALGTAWLAVLVNMLTAALGLSTVLLYVLIYTPLKRRTSLNTLVGAIPGAIPPMMGVTAFSGEVTPIGWALFGILFLWQMPHFYGLAMLCREDYSRGGFVMLPSLPHGPQRTARQSIVFLILLLPTSLLPTLLGVSGWYYAVAATALGVWFLMAGLECRRTLANTEARRLFLTSILYLPLLLVAMMLDRQ